MEPTETELGCGPASVSSTGDSGPTDLGPWCCYADEVGMYGDGVCTPEDPRHAPTHCGYDNVRRGLVPAPPAAPPSPPERADDDLPEALASDLLSVLLNSVSEDDGDRDWATDVYGKIAPLITREFYPCKPDIFAVTYEPAAAPVQPRGDQLGVLREALERADAMSPGEVMAHHEHPWAPVIEAVRSLLAASPATADRTDGDDA